MKKGDKYKIDKFWLIEIAWIIGAALVCAAVTVIFSIHLIPRSWYE